MTRKYRPLPLSIAAGVTPDSTASSAAAAATTSRQNQHASTRGSVPSLQGLNISMNQTLGFTTAISDSATMRPPPPAKTATIILGPAPMDIGWRAGGPAQGSVMCIGTGVRTSAQGLSARAQA